MDTIGKLRDFLSDIEVQKLINFGKFETVYDILYKLNIGIDVTGKLTDVLYNAGIDPLKYMKNIPAHFAYKSNREHFDIPSTIKSIGAGAFSYCTKLKEIDIPEGVSKIGWAAFGNCRSLTSIYIPDSVHYLKATFFGCQSLESVSLPGGIELTFWNIFEDCNNLKEIEYRGTINQYAGTGSCESFVGKDVITKDGRLSTLTYLGPNNLSGINEIGHYAFYGCANLKEVEIPTNITKIGAKVFIKCPKLKFIKYLGTTEQWDNIDIYNNNIKLKKIRIFCKDGEYSN